MINQFPGDFLVTGQECQEQQGGPVATDIIQGTLREMSQRTDVPCRSLHHLQLQEATRPVDYPITTTRGNFPAMS